MVVLGTEQYGIALADLVEAIPFARCTPIPKRSPELLGVINVRGTIRSAIDLGRLLGLPERAGRGRLHSAAVRKLGQEVGLRVDQVEKVRLLSPEEGFATSSPFLKGRGEGVLLLDTEAIFAHPLFVVSAGIQGGSGGARPPTAPSEARPLPEKSRRMEREFAQ